jgi:hypothetical protein
MWAIPPNDESDIDRLVKRTPAKEGTALVGTIGASDRAVHLCKYGMVPPDMVRHPVA